MYYKFTRWFSVFFFFLGLQVTAQDFRASQYNAAPLLLNPSQTGDFSGRWRLTGLHALVKNDSLQNQISNFSFDAALGKNRSWAYGINYMISGDPSFSVSGKYIGISVANGFYLDAEKKHQFRTGIQVSHLTASNDIANENYDRLLDVTALKHRYGNTSARDHSSVKYLNLSAGMKYAFTTDRIKFESGIGAYNITNPRGWDPVAQSGWRKRMRMSIATAFSFAFNKQNSFRLEQLSWKEGLNLRNFKDGFDDSVRINENTYGLTWLRSGEKTGFSVGLFTRDWKAVYGMVGLQVSPKLNMRFSYEKPVHKVYYGISHFELSVAFIPLQKMKPVQRPKLVPEIQTTGVPDRIKNATEKKDTLYHVMLLSPQQKIQTVSDSVKQIPAIPENIYFDFDDFRINRNAALVADRLVSYLQANPDLHISLIGHASFEGTYTHNMKLSDKRAQSVFAYLMSFGINPIRVQTFFKGNTNATMFTGKKETRWPDRKVVITTQSVLTVNK